MAPYNSFIGNGVDGMPSGNALNNLKSIKDKKSVDTE